MRELRKEYRKRSRSRKVKSKTSLPSGSSSTSSTDNSDVSSIASEISYDFKFIHRDTYQDASSVESKNKNGLKYLYTPSEASCSSENSLEENLCAFSTDLTLSESYPNFFQDHNYASLNGVKVDKPPYEPRKSTERKKRFQRIQPQFIIKTPPFPYVHIPLLFELAEIKEIGIDLNPTDRMQDLSMFTPFIPTSNKSLLLRVPRKTVKQNNRMPRSKKQDVTGSVLECVENRVNVKASTTSMTKNTCTAVNNTVENLENMQKIEKELALKLITKLHSKKKKQYQGPLECQICQDKHFTALATLIHHYRSHAGIKPYACNICDSTFTRQHSLNYHMLIHQNKTRFTCEFCGRTFRHPSHYREHLGRHKEETPFHCYGCNLHFKTRNTFKRHLKIRHKKLLTAHGFEDLIANAISGV